MAFYTAIAGLLIILSHLIGHRFLSAEKSSAGRLSSFASGVSVAYVFLQVLPKLAYSDLFLAQSELLSSARWHHHAFLLAMLGLVVFLGVDRLSQRLGQKVRPRAAFSHFHIIVLIYTLYNFLVGYLLSFYWLVAGGRALFTYALAMSLHFLLVGYILRRHHPTASFLSVRWWFACAIALGWLASLFQFIPSASMALLLAFLAGAILVITLKEELRDDSVEEFFVFVLGVVIYTLLLMRI